MYTNLYSDVVNCSNAGLKVVYDLSLKMSILSRLTYSLVLKLNMFLPVFEFERRIGDPELQINALAETSSAKMNTQNRAATEHFICGGPIPFYTC